MNGTSQLLPYPLCLNAFQSSAELFCVWRNLDLVGTNETVHEGLDGGVWYSLFIKNLAHYSSH